MNERDHPSLHLNID